MTSVKSTVIVALDYDNQDFHLSPNSSMIDSGTSSVSSIVITDIDGKLIPMIGNAGDAIFFDTNTPHKAGIIEEGYSRKILKFDFERPSFNLQNPIKNLIDKFIN